MGSIGIVGSGIAGLQLGLFLQHHGHSATLYSDRSPEQIRTGRLINLVVRFHHTRERERALGIEHWDDPDFGVFGVRMQIGLEDPIVWRGSFGKPGSGVDMRIYQSTLLEDFAARGGAVQVAALEAADVVRLSEQHDLMVVASGRGSLSEMFPRDPERSPFAHPQRRLFGAFCHGVDFPDPLGVVFTINPGLGEIFQAPFTSFGGRVCSLLVEAIPGQPFEAITRMPYEDDPKAFESGLLALIREHAPHTYEHIRPAEFGVTRPLDLLQGAVTPTVRHAVASLGNGKFALALGDMHIVNDPIVAQGGNTASRCAAVLGAALLRDPRIDERFCRDMEQRLWQEGRAATQWTNLTLQPPPPYVMDIFQAAARNRAIGDELSGNFNAPERNWEILGSAEGAAAFLACHAAR